MLSGTPNFITACTTGRPKHYWHEHVKGYHGRNLGITNSDGPKWTEQRRFALKQLKDLGFGTKSLDSVMVAEADRVIDRYKHDRGRRAPRLRDY